MDDRPQVRCVDGPALCAGYLADLALGDPSRFHPVAGFGRLASAVERAAYAPTRARGGLVTIALVAGTAAAAQALARLTSRRAACAVVAWCALGGRSLRGEAVAVAGHLRRERLDLARERLRSLCGRDADALDEEGLCRAVIESLAENTSDAVVGALLWGVLAGPAGIAGYRAANTLDAMFGHHNERYREFGWAAARLDDVLNWPAARLSAALACLLAPVAGGSPLDALLVVRRDGAAHPSPNAGRVEAAFAGALGLTLGGPLAYGGAIELRPALGRGRAPVIDDVDRAARLSIAVGTAAALLCAAVAR